MCSEHFISKKKADLPNNPDYVPSVYPHEAAKKKCSGNSNFNMNGESLARFEQAQRRAAASEKERIEKEREDERVCTFVQRVSNTIMVVTASPIEHHVKVLNWFQCYLVAKCKPA